MTWGLFLIVTGAFFGAVITGGAGFAFAIVATVFWIHELTPPQLVMLAAACASTLHLASLWHFRRSIDYRRLWPFLIGGTLGAPFGILAVRYVHIEQFRVAIGLLIIAYSSFLAVGPRFGRLALTGGRGRVADTLIGWVGGVMGGAVMLQGIVPTLWCVVRGWNKTTSRCVYQPYILFVGLYVMLLSGFSVGRDAEKIGLLYLMCLPALGLGFVLGAKLFGWASETVFIRLTLGFLFVSGIFLLF